jgi:hypothetical protein
MAQPQKMLSYRVQPLPGGRWELRQEGGMVAVYDDEHSALTAAVELARTRGPGKVTILAADGTVESERTLLPLPQRRT